MVLILLFSLNYGSRGMLILYFVINHYVASVYSYPKGMLDNVSIANHIENYVQNSLT